MSNHLAARMGTAVQYRQSSPLSNDQIRAVAPSVFAQEAHESRSARYQFIPTIEVLDGLRREGFQPFMVAQGRTRIPGKADFTKHMLRLRHAGDIAAKEANEIILINSHDGASSYQMLSGLLNFVCCNGLVCGNKYEDIRVKHSGNITSDVVQGAFRVLDGFNLIRDVTDEMKAITLNGDEQRVFAETALLLKYDGTDENGNTTSPIQAEALLTARRFEDRGPELWNTFNRVQENIIRGGLRGVMANSRRATTRPVQAIDTDVKLNRALWTLAEKMAELKR